MLFNYSFARANEPPVNYGAVQGEEASLLPQDEEGSCYDDRWQEKVKLARSVFVTGCVLVILAILLLITQPCLHKLQRQRWVDEVAAHEKLLEDHRQHWEQEETDYEQRRNVHLEEQQKWIAEKADYEQRRLAHLQEQQKWTAEKAEMEQWKADLERKRGDIIWGDHRDLGCSKYSKRSHSATLTNVPAGLNPRKECELKTMYIDGQWLLPFWCEDPQLCGRTIGHWEVDSNLCKPYISKYEDHGCIKRATRQYKGKLENIQDWNNWRKICMTMPGFYDGTDLGLPYYCSACNGGDCGYWAEWIVQDHTCSSSISADSEHSQNLRFHSSDDV